MRIRIGAIYLTSYISILERYKTELEHPGVYRFMGINPLTLEENYPLYVGLAGQEAFDFIKEGKASQKVKKPQMLRGRIKRHLTDDAGVLGNIIDDIRYLSAIDYWVVDPTQFQSKIDFISTLTNLEYEIRSETPTYYDEDLKLSSYSSKTVVLANPALKKILQEIKKQKQVISLEGFQLSDIESQFQQIFQVLTTSPIRRYIKFRQYNRISYLFQSLFNYWDLLDKKNLHWTHFEATEKAPTAQLGEKIQGRPNVEKRSQEPTFIGWEEWCKKYVHHDIELFDLDVNGPVKIRETPGRRYLTRKTAVDNLLLSEIEKMKDNPTQYEGIIAMMYWKIKGNVIPLHVTATEITSASNLTPRTLARWGYEDQRLFDLMSRALFDNAKNQCKKWIPNLFDDINQLTLKRPVFFWAKAWETTDMSLTGNHLPLKEFKEQVINLLNPLLSGSSARESVKKEKGEIED